MSDTLIAEDLLLLLTDDRRGSVREYSSADYVLGGALLMELALAGRVRITEEGESAHKAGRVTITDASPTDDDILDDALARLAAKPDCKPQKVIDQQKNGRGGRTHRCRSQMLDRRRDRTQPCQIKARRDQEDQEGQH